MADPSLLPTIIYGPQTLLGVIPEHHQVWPKNKIDKWSLSLEEKSGISRIEGVKV